MLSIFRSQSETICKDGVEIEIKIQSTTPKDININNESAKEEIKKMYLSTKIHDTLYNLNKLAEYTSKDFIKEDIIKLFETLLEVDYQSYYDILCIISSIICALDEKNYAEFSNKICNIINDNNESSDTNEDHMVDKCLDIEDILSESENADSMNVDAADLDSSINNKNNKKSSKKKES